MRCRHDLPAVILCTLKGSTSYITFKRQSPDTIKKTRRNRRTKPLAEARVSRSLIPTARSGEALVFRQFSFIHDGGSDVVKWNLKETFSESRKVVTRCAVSALKSYRKSQSTRKVPIARSHPTSSGCPHQHGTQKKRRT